MMADHTESDPSPLLEETFTDLLEDFLNDSGMKDEFCDDTTDLKPVSPDFPTNQFAPRKYVNGSPKAKVGTQWARQSPCLKANNEPNCFSPARKHQKFSFTTKSQGRTANSGSTIPSGDRSGAIQTVRKTAKPANLKKSEPEQPKNVKGVLSTSSNTGDLRAYFSKCSLGSDKPSDAEPRVPLTPPPVVNPVPPASVVPVLAKIDDWDNIKFAFFDLETTSLQLDCDIIQISAVCGEESDFNVYMNPTQAISWNAAKVTGLTKRRGVLRYKRKPVKTSTPFFAINSFIRWLEKHSPCVLVGHNARTFDSKRLVRFAMKFNLGSKLANATRGFLDTLPVFRAAYPEYGDHKLENLYQRLFAERLAQSHNAVADTRALKRIFEKTKDRVSWETITSASFTFVSLVEVQKAGELGHQKAETFRELVEGKVLSEAMAERAGMSGLGLGEVEATYKRSGKEGLADLFKGETVPKKPRVTKSSVVIDKVAEYLAHQFP